MKKITLNETWKRCLAMWQWIVKELKARPEADISELKEEWVDKNHPEDLAGTLCYFCDWHNAHRKAKGQGCCLGCPGCPGCLVSPRFNCYKAGWGTNPARFLRTLKRLNKKRLAKKEAR